MGKKKAQQRRQPLKKGCLESAAQLKKQKEEAAATEIDKQEQAKKKDAAMTMASLTVPNTMPELATATGTEKKCQTSTVVVKPMGCRPFIQLPVEQAVPERISEQFYLAHLRQYTNVYEKHCLTAHSGTKLHTAN